MTTPLDRAIHPDEKTMLFIDGANLYSATRGLGFDIDYKRLLDEFKKRGRLLRANYYTAILEDQDFSPVRPLVDWLDYNGYALITKPAKEYTDATGRRRIKGDMDVELAVDMLTAADFTDHLFLFSGDGDFVSVIDAVKRKGARVSVISTVRSNPPMASDELRRQADNFIDLAELATLIGRPPREGRTERRYEPEYEEDDNA